MKLIVGRKGLLIKTNGKISKRSVMLIVLALLVLIAGIFGIMKYRDEQKALSEKASIETKTFAYATDLDDSKETMTSVDAVVDYLTNWAKTKGVSCESDDSGNVIMDVAAAKGYKKVKPTLLVCSYSVDNFDGCIAPMSLCLYLAKNKAETGHLRILFTDNTGNNFNGIKALDKDYISDVHNIICVNGNSNNFWSTTTGGRSTYEFTKEYSTARIKTKGNKAIRITVEGLPGGIPALTYSSYPNPIKTLGNLLASFKTNAYIFKLADFHGGSSGNVLPKDACATIVINENDYKKFTDKLDSYIEKQVSKRSEKFPDFKITYKEVKLPKRVMEQKDADEFVSVIYTLLDGVYYKNDNGDVISSTNIGCVSEADGVYTILASASSLEEASLTEIDNTYKTICGLSNIKYRRLGGQAKWTVEEEDTLPSKIHEAFNIYSGNNLEFSPSVAPSAASYLRKYNVNAEIICVNLNSDRLERYTGTLLTYLKNQKPKK